jgi:hypothetical protein
VTIDFGPGSNVFPTVKFSAMDHAGKNKLNEQTYRYSGPYSKGLEHFNGLDGPYKQAYLPFDRPPHGELVRQGFWATEFQY